MDKFLTDLAAYVGAETITVEWRGYWHNDDGRFLVTLWLRDDAQPHGWRAYEGTGPTVESAMSAAIASMEAEKQEAA